MLNRGADGLCGLKRLGKSACAAGLIGGALGELQGEAAPVHARRYTPWQDVPVVRAHLRGLVG